MGCCNMFGCDIKEYAMNYEVPWCSGILSLISYLGKQDFVMRSWFLYHVRLNLHLQMPSTRGICIDFMATHSIQNMA